MSDVTTLSKTAEKQIIKGVQKTIELVKQAGLTPTKALAQVVKEAEFTPDMIRRMGEAYNTSKTLSFLEKNAGMNRTNDFPIVDVGEVLREAFPDKYQAPGAEKVAEQVFKVGPMQKAASFNYNEAMAGSMTKTAAAEIPLVTGTLVPSYDIPDNAFEDVETGLLMLDLLKKEAAAHTSNYLRSNDTMMNKLSKVAEEIRAAGIPFEVIEEGIAYNYGDKQGTAMAELFFKAANCAVMHEKRASTFEPRVVDFDREPYKSIREFAHWSEKVACDKACVAKADAAIKTHKSKMLEKLAEKSPFANTSKALGMVKDTIFGNGLASNDSYKKELASAMADVEAPDHRDELRSIDTKAMLNNMVANDEVISGYAKENPNAIVDAYNEISKLAPDAAAQPLVVKGMLRRYLQQKYLEPFEAGQLAGTSKTVHDANAPQQSNLQNMMKSSPTFAAAEGQQGGGDKGEKGDKGFPNPQGAAVKAIGSFGKQGEWSIFKRKGE